MVNPAIRAAVERQAEYADTYKKEDLEILLAVLSDEERRIFDEHYALINRVETTPEAIAHRAVAFILHTLGGLSEEELERYSFMLPKKPWKAKFRKRFTGFRKRVPRASLPRSSRSD